MKGIDIFCASQASTSIYHSMEELGSSSSPTSIIQLAGGSLSGSRKIDRHNPIIGDSRRTTPPICPKPHNRKNNTTSSKTSKETKKLKGYSRKPLIEDEQKRKSCDYKANENGVVIKSRRSSSSSSSWRCMKPGEFITPPGSSRYLLSEKDLNLLDALSDNFDPVLKLESYKSGDQAVKLVAEDESCLTKPPPSSSSRPGDQVVVLRVSLHCKGCEKKMRKHISRMEGVTSFNIDFAAKKVTVIGDVTPLGVLASISKVKNAQLWPPTLESSPKPNLINSELIKNHKQLVVTPHEKTQHVSPNALAIQLF